MSFHLNYSFKLLFVRSKVHRQVSQIYSQQTRELSVNVNLSSTFNMPFNIKIKYYFNFYHLHLANLQIALSINFQM